MNQLGSSHFRNGGEAVGLGGIRKEGHQGIHNRDTLVWRPADRIHLVHPIVVLAAAKASAAA